MEDALAALGRKQLDLEAQQASFAELYQQYQNLLLLLDGVVKGEIKAEDIQVDLVAVSWARIIHEAPKEEQPAED